MKSGEEKRGGRKRVKEKIKEKKREEIVREIDQKNSDSVVFLLFLTV